MNKTATELIESRMNRMKRDYVKENDIIPNAPNVTFTDMTLMTMVYDLARKIDSMEAGKPQPQVEAIQAAYNCLRMALGDWYEFDLQHQPDMTHFQCKRAIEFVEYAMRSSDGRA